ncbi:hypothetical protein ACFFGH_16220 [Lysobacter korlensis]|uniref:Uncharacterized protein n=1 Tax=Lysobacter korlensis TaxID=553636 RepID=A0ABV6RQX6_9GAMM
MPKRGRIAQSTRLRSTLTPRRRTRKYSLVSGPDPTTTSPNLTMYVLAAIAVFLGVCAFLAWRRRRPCTYANVAWEIDRVSPEAIAELKYAADDGVAVCQVRYVGQQGFHTVATGEPARAAYQRHLARCGSSLAQAASHYVSAAMCARGGNAELASVVQPWPAAAAAGAAPAVVQPTSATLSQERPVVQK